MPQPVLHNGFTVENQLKLILGVHDSASHPVRAELDPVPQVGQSLTTSTAVEVLKQLLPSLPRSLLVTCWATNRRDGEAILAKLASTEQAAGECPLVRAASRCLHGRIQMLLGHVHSPGGFDDFDEAERITRGDPLKLSNSDFAVARGFALVEKAVCAATWSPQELQNSPAIADFVKNTLRDALSILKPHLTHIETPDQTAWAERALLPVLAADAALQAHIILMRLSEGHDKREHARAAETLSNAHNLDLYEYVEGDQVHKVLANAADAVARFHFTPPPVPSAPTAQPH